MWKIDFRLPLPHRSEQTELVLFLIFVYCGSTFRTSWASPLATATRTNQELVLFKSSYISSLYDILITHQYIQQQDKNGFFVDQILARKKLFYFLQIQPKKIVQGQGITCVCTERNFDSRPLMYTKICLQFIFLRFFWHILSLN